MICRWSSSNLGTLWYPRYGTLAGDSSWTVFFSLRRGSVGTIPANIAASMHSLLKDSAGRIDHHHIDILHHVGGLAGRVLQCQLPGVVDVSILWVRSFFQSACLLGYCLFPLNVASFVTLLIGNFIPSAIKLVIVALSFIWATLCKFEYISKHR